MKPCVVCLAQDAVPHFASRNIVRCRCCGFVYADVEIDPRQNRRVLCEHLPLKIHPIPGARRAPYGCWPSACTACPTACSMQS